MSLASRRRGRGQATPRTVSVIVCAYTVRRWEPIQLAIASLEAQTRRPDEIILVVDHCGPLLRRAEASFSGVSTIPNAERRGLSGARNTGVRAATGDVVAFLDDDAVADPSWLQHLLEPYNDPSVVGAGGSVVPAWERRRPGWFPPEFDWVVGCSHSGMPSEPSQVRNFVGANMSFRRSALERAGAFSGELGRLGTIPAGCEETELCIRIQQQQPGARLVYEPVARVHHLVPTDRARWRYFHERCFAEGRSKATVAGLAGAKQGLSDERGYVRRTLPAGVASALRQSLTHPARVASAGAIVAGLAVTTAGYLTSPRRRNLELDPPAPGTTGVQARAAAPVHSPDVAAPVAPAHEAVPGESLRVRPRTGLHLAALCAALVAWLVSLHGVDLRAMSFGLISALPATYWLALLLLSLSFAGLVWRATARRWLLAAHAIVFVLVLHATPALLYGTIRYAWTFKHIGVVDYLLHHHQATAHLGQFSVYTGWPGFFSLNALLVGGSGLGSAMHYAAWAPPVFELLMMAPLVTILRTFTDDQRHVWLAVWVFYLGNWVGQDYFSPQAFTLFLYLAVIALCLRWFPDGRGEHARSPRILTRLHRRAHTRRSSTTGTDVAPQIPLPETASRGRLLVVISVMVLAIASGHQLTPMMLIAALGLLWVTRVRKVGAVLLISIVLTVGWSATFGRVFLSQSGWILSSIGHPASNSQAVFVNASAVGHVSATVAMFDRVLSAAVWVLALAGLWRRRGSFRHDLPLVLLAVSPLPLVVANSYGGEMLFRVYLFGLPFVAFFAASAFFPSRRAGRSLLALGAVAVTAILLLAAFTVSYYGKEKGNYFTAQEMAGSNWLMDNAPKGSLVVGITANMPWAYERVGDFVYDWVEFDSGHALAKVLHDPTDALAHTMRGPQPSYLVFSRSVQTDIDMRAVLPEGGYGRIERAVAASPQFRPVFRNTDMSIYELVR